MTVQIMCGRCRKRPVHPSRVYGYRCEDCWADTFGASAGRYARPAAVREQARATRPTAKPRKGKGAAS